MRLIVDVVSTTNPALAGLPATRRRLLETLKKRGEAGADDLAAALGITVSGTLHLVNWFRIGIRQGKTRTEAVSLALGQCGPAMWQTTLVVSVGLATLCSSDLISIVQAAVIIFVAAPSIISWLLRLRRAPGETVRITQREVDAPAT